MHAVLASPMQLFCAAVRSSVSAQVSCDGVGLWFKCIRLNSSREFPVGRWQAKVGLRTGYGNEGKGAMKSRPALSLSALRVDAKAAGLVVAVGGCSLEYNSEGRIVKKMSKWLSMRLSQEEAPWVSARGLRCKRVATQDG